MPSDDTEDITQRIPRESVRELKRIPVVCPWCNKVFTLANYEVEKGKKTEITHKICPDCLKKLKDSEELPK